MNTTHHKGSLADQAAMQTMRAELRLHPALDFGPEARSVFDEIIARTPAAQNVSYEAAMVGGVPGWWCRPANAIEGAAVLYLHGGAYILGSAIAYRNFAGQIAARAKAAAFIADYRLAPEHRFPGAVEDAIAAYRGRESARWKHEEQTRLQTAGSSPMKLTAFLISVWFQAKRMCTLPPRKLEKLSLVRKDEIRKGQSSIDRSLKRSRFICQKLCRRCVLREPIVGVSPEHGRRSFRHLLHCNSSHRNDALNSARLRSRISQKSNIAD
jgi:hypothetical protein